jgi:hypothetical protein
VVCDSDGGRLRPSRRASARASREPARARASLQRARRPVQGGLRTGVALAARRFARGSERSTCSFGAGRERAACRARHRSSAPSRGREADPAAGSPGVRAVHVGGLARHQAGRATARGGEEPCHPPPLRSTMGRGESSVPGRRTPSRATSNEKESPRSVPAGRFIPTSARFSIRSGSTGSRASPSTWGRSCSGGRCSISARERRASSSS